MANDFKRAQKRAATFSSRNDLPTQRAAVESPFDAILAVDAVLTGRNVVGKGAVVGVLLAAIASLADVELRVEAVLVLVTDILTIGEHVDGVAGGERDQRDEPKR